MLSGIKAVFIDVDNTLLDFDECARDSMFLAAKELEISVPDNLFTIFKGINDGLWQRMERKEIEVSDIFGYRWNVIFEKTKTDCDGMKFEQFFQKYLYESCVPEKGAIELVKYLSGKYRVFAASNGKYMQQIKRLYNAGIYYCLADVYASERVGYSKPSREFFEKCLFYTGRDVKADEVVMIGDSMTADIGGAIGIGMHSIWYNKYAVENTVYDPEITVISLSDIKNYL